jgi:membrane-associated PAP2 superfamily phosphatase
VRRHAAGRFDLLVTWLALACLLAWDASGWDLALSHWYGTAAGFPWRDAWLTRSLLHDGGRLFAWGALGLLAVDACHPLLPGPKRIERWHWIGVMLASALLVPSIKLVTTTSCPWELAEFGGVASYVSHWQIGVSDGGPGHCFPSGHAVAAFAFFGLYFLWREHRPRLARCFLAIVLLAGSLFGWAQLARGAHYFSHTLWSAWLCWTLCVLGARASVPGFRRLQVSPARHGDFVRRDS